MKFKLFLINLLSLFLIMSCAPKSPVEKIGNQFVRNYYQEMNQFEAIKISSMMAEDKLKKEIALVSSSRAKNSNSTNYAARVTYQLEDTKVENNMAFLSYKLTIRPQNSDSYDRGALITLQNNKDEWKVINFEEINFR